MLFFYVNNKWVTNDVLTCVLYILALANLFQLNISPQIRSWYEMVLGIWTENLEHTLRHFMTECTQVKVSMNSITTVLRIGSQEEGAISHSALL